MPRITQTEDWLKPFRRQIIASCADGWLVRHNRGKIRLNVPGVGTVSLPYEWSERGAALALPRIQQIFKRWNGGTMTLAEAAQLANTSSSHQQIDFSALITKYREEVPHAGEQTWKDFYLPVLVRCRNEFKGTAPRGGEELCDAILKKWDHGSRMRQSSRQKLYGFLRWAVRKGHLKPVYLPPEGKAELLKPKPDGFPLEDRQILLLLDSLDHSEAHERWRFAIQLCAVYGLRPEELRYLRIKEGTQGLELWSMYRKSMGGKKGLKTEPRRLHPLLVRDASGKPVDWNLQERLTNGEELPPLNRAGDGSQALNGFLRRRHVWQQFVSDAAAVEEKLVPYSFRHRYAKTAHAANIPVLNICEMMGHTLDVHQKSYARFAPSKTAELVAAANA